MNIAFFDFDGTITCKDSFIDFIVYCFGYRKLFSGILSVGFYLFLYKVKIIPNWRAKEIFFSYFFRNYDYKLFCDLGKKYAIERLPEIIPRESFNQIDKHKQNKDSIVIVSASADEWIKPWCDSLGIDILSTSYAVDNGKLTG